MRRLGLVLLLACAACGYHLAGNGPGIPQAARTISIKPFHNLTHEHGLEVRLQRAVEDEFRRRGRLEVVDEPKGDLVLSGEIRSLASVPVAFSGTDEAVQYQSVMLVSVHLEEREGGHLVYETKNLYETQDFGAVSGVVIESSPRFQRGTIDARDLAQLNNVQLGESRRRDAIRGLLESTAHDIFVQSMEGF